MKKLLNTLFITSSDKYLSLDGENIVVLCDSQEVARLPLHNLEAIVTFGYTGASPALMGACAKRGIAISFMTQSGRFLATVTGEVKGNVTLRKTQYRISDDDVLSLAISKNFITGKIYNSRQIIERAIRDYPMRLDIDLLKQKSLLLQKSIERVKSCQNIDVLRGIEGEAASEYFSVFNDLILQQKDDFYFHNRNKRPPLDNVNAMLSFAYSLLASNVSAALSTVGLDPYVGFMHKDRPGRISLALDLMEELRCIFADRFVLSLINKKMINASGFVKKENGAIIMKDETRKVFLTAWQERKQEKITHPFLEEKIEWGMVPYVQAMLLARFIRGDLDGYPPFLWK